MEENTFETVKQIANYFTRSPVTIRKRLKRAVDEFEMPYLETKLGWIYLRTGLEEKLPPEKYRVILQGVEREHGIFLHYFHEIRATDPEVRKLDIHFNLEEPLQGKAIEDGQFLLDTTACMEKAARKKNVILVQKSFL